MFRGQRLLQTCRAPWPRRRCGRFAHPLDADALQRPMEIGLLRRFGRVGGARGQHVLSAGRRRIVVVDDDDRHAVRLVEHGVADERGDRPLCQKPPSPMIEIAAAFAAAVEGGVGRPGRARSPWSCRRFRTAAARRTGDSRCRRRSGARRVPPRPASSPRRSAARGSRCRSPAAAERHRLGEIGHRTACRALGARTAAGQHLRARLANELRHAVRA